MSYFHGRDLKLIENLEFNPELEPSFDALKYCLIWDDERPEGLTPEGYESLCDLWIARSFLHREISFSSWDLDPGYFEHVWKEATEKKLKWSGFNRLKLNAKDKQFFLQQMEEQKSSKGGL